MLRKEDLVFSQETFAARRRKLMDQIEPGSIIIIPSAMPQNRNADNNHLFRQDSSFYYLTGFPEPLAIAVLIPGRAEGEYILFNRASDPHTETFTGKMAGQLGAVSEYSANASFDIKDFKKEIYPLFKASKKMYFPMGGCHTFFLTEDRDGASLEDIFNECFRERRVEIFQRSADPFTLDDPARFIQQMRLIKEPLELDFMQHAVNISIQGHMRTLQSAPEDKTNEMTLSSNFVHEIMHHGTQEVSYPNIVGAGSHSCTLHYQKNDSEIHDGDVVLNDSGAEYKNYASDITRTFPINGKFTKEQRAIYNLVEETQQKCFQLVKPGATLLEVHDFSVREITKGLIGLGILKGDLENLITTKAYTEFYPHGVGHWLGMDVHDTSMISGRTTKFAPGMVLTVEPGVYIAEPKEVDPKWHHIGVRIEDDLVVMKEGHRVMSAALPKKAQQIEEIMRGWVPKEVKKLGYQNNSLFPPKKETRGIKREAPKDVLVMKKMKTS